MPRHGTNLGEILKLIDFKIDSAVKSLRPTSDNLKNLPLPASFPYRAIAAYANSYTVLEAFLDRAFNYVGRASVDVLLNPGENPALNDVIVPLDSQIDGGKVTRVYKGFVHSEIGLGNGVLASQPVIKDVICTLQNGSTCQGNLIQASATLKSSKATATTLQTTGADATVPGDIDLTGYQEVTPTGISLSRSPSGKLLLGTDYSLTINVVNPNIKGIRYMLEDGTARSMGKMSNAGETITMKPTSFDPVKLTVIVDYLNKTYAVKSFSFPLDTLINAVIVAHESEVVRLAGTGATYQLRPEAYLDAPHQGKLAVAAWAVYTVVTGAANVSVGLDGTVKALKLGQAEVLSQFGGAETKVRAIVDPA